ncbi:hypothetical protein N7478_006964 [Penicillium angulare]|uniref:uncharacterized protein n=1 Tax=Penicillium angulare TaxID=116970 RepID=UPI002542621A|nr:uncharacterized protein N7478_006964 [Penicillium angulare]KAJ5281592.1 hypothetical protein N7478_006964 [Penicillium angulare]
MTGEARTEAEPSGLVNTLQGHVDDVRGLIQCGICIRPLYEPFTIACGHTFCYSCLASWFAGGKSKRTCPDCRAPVKTQPAPAYLVRAIVQMFTSRPELLDREDTTADHSKNHREESDRLDRDKANTDPVSGGLFGGLFKPPQPKPIVDIEDGVTRCPLCSFELEDGINCGGCGYIYQPDPEGTDYSGSDISDSDLGSMIEGDTDSEEDYEGEQQHHHHHHHQPPMNPFAPSYRPPGSFDPPMDYGRFFMNAFPHGIPGVRMNWQPQRVNHSTHYWPSGRPLPDSDAGEEEEEEEEDDEYGGSFIDDGEEGEEDIEAEESQSDRSTVVGTTHTYSHSFSRIPPLVRYPPVYGPTSAPEVDYDWESEDDDAIARLRGPWQPDDNYEVLSEGDSHEVQSSSVYGADEIEEEDEDEDEDDEVPHRGISCRQYLPTSMDVAENDPSEDECSSSPPRARQPIPQPPRDIGLSARTAITIDDSDEEPVGPVRRTAHRRQQVRFSPY